MPGDRLKEHSVLIDFAAKSTLPLMNYASRISLGDLTLCECRFGPNAGMVLGSSQLVVGVHTGEPYELIVRHGAANEVRSINPGAVNITAADTPIYLEWGEARPRVNVIAIQQAAVRRILSGAAVNPNTRLRSTFGVHDRVLRQLADACESGISENDGGGRLFADGLAMALVTHIYRIYSGAPTLTPSKGGLTPRDTRRVLSYIEDHLQDDIGLEELAAAVDLSTHYFTEAFRKVVGMPPYRYVLNQRVERAKGLLSASELTVAKISEEVGFSSQAQFTTNFRKIVGTTPGRYRRNSD